LFKNHAFIYARNKRLGGMSPQDRVQRVRAKLFNLGTEILGEVIEGSSLSNERLQELIQEHREIDPIIAVNTFKDVSDYDTAKMLTDGSVSVIVADELKTPTNSLEEVLPHLVQTLHQLQNSVKGTESNKQNPMNSARASTAKEFAEKIYPEMVQATKEKGVNSRRKVATHLNEKGLLTATGKPITTTQLTRYAKAAGKVQEWERIIVNFDYQR
jgi:hypothetical protein